MCLFCFGIKFGGLVLALLVLHAGAYHGNRPGSMVADNIELGIWMVMIVSLY